VYWSVDWSDCAVVAEDWSLDGFDASLECTELGRREAAEFAVESTDDCTLFAAELPFEDPEESDEPADDAADESPELELEDADGVAQFAPVNTRRATHRKAALRFEGWMDTAAMATREPALVENSAPIRAR
jgi:hypothetical protein